jgi:IMP and pyridine-specific 5'-nucleotidase
MSAFYAQELLDDAQVHLAEGAARLCMPVQLIRKTRSVGVVPTQPTIYEVRLRPSRH